MNCISIDDEPLAHKVIKNYCDQLEVLHLKASFKRAADAIPYLNNHKVDLIFLDINMPVLKGLDFLRTLSNPPMIIVTTAYQEYAVESFELNVLDYLLKPFAFDRFLMAINKAHEKLRLMSGDERNHSLQVGSKPTQDQCIIVKSEKKLFQIHLSDILYLESAGSYVKIHTEKEMIITYERLVHFEKSLPASSFKRVHKSFIVATPHIHSIEGNQIQIRNRHIPIGQVYKMNLKSFFRFR